jgi:hypothetical protein
MHTIPRQIRIRALILLIAVFCVLEIASAFLPHLTSWDGSVYVGMGKFIFSHGTVGIWETLRPVGFPIVLGLFWKLGIDPYLAGQMLSILASAFVIYLTYKIADLLFEGAGIIAALLIAFTPLFFMYASIPMTDIISTALVLGSVHMVLRPTSVKNIFLSGLLAGLAFLFRFPQGLVLVVSGLVITVREWQESGTLLALGFAVVAVPFFVANSIAYHDPFLPLKAGADIIARVPAPNIRSASFYLDALNKVNVFAIFAILALAYFIKERKYRTSLAWIASIIFLALYLAYFSHLPHKELRYSLAFLPLTLVFASVGLALVLERIGSRSAALCFVALLFATGIYTSRAILLQATKPDGIYDQVGASLREYQKVTGRPATLLSASPFPAIKSNSKIVDTIYDDWREVPAKYTADKSLLSHVLIDTCTLEYDCSYDDGCTDGMAQMFAAMKKDATVAVDGMAGLCHITLYQLVSKP